MKKITISVPAYNEEENILAFYNKLTSYFKNNIKNYNYELLFINDGSKDNTGKKIKEIEAIDENVIGIDLSRNYGKEIAMAAGFDHASGDAVITMDADLQHPFTSIKEMILLWENGYQDVYGRRIKRHGESFLKVKLSNSYYRLLNKVSQTKMLSNVGDFRLLDRQVIDSLKKIRERHRYTKGLYEWVGYRKIEFTFEALERYTGTTKWNFAGLISLAIEGVTSNSTLPLKFSSYIGFFVSIISILYMIFIFFTTIINGIPYTGIPTITILVLFLGGVQLISLGIIGEYLGRIFIEVKNRPLYLINESTIKNTNEGLDEEC